MKLFYMWSLCEERLRHRSAFYTKNVNKMYFLAQKFGILSASLLYLHQISKILKNSTMIPTTIKRVKPYTVFKVTPDGERYIRLRYDFSTKLYNCLNYVNPTYIIKFHRDTRVYVYTHFSDDLPF